MAEKTSSEHFEELFYFARKVLNICGVDVLNKNYKIGWITAFVFALVNTAIALALYTIYKDAMVTGEYENLFKSASVLGTGIQGYTKLVNIIKQQNDFRFLYKEISETYSTYELKLSYNRYLNYNVLLVKKLLTTLLAIIIITTAAVIGIPVVMLLVFGTRIEVLPFKMPYVDEETDFGYFFKFTVQIICVLFGGVGNFVIDMSLFIYVGQVPLLKNILKCKIDDLNAILEEHPRDRTNLEGPLNDIFKWHQKYNAYCDAIKNTFYWVIFVQISSEFCGITCTIVCIFLDIWMPAPIYLFYLLAMVYSYCSLGNLVEVSNDDIIVIVYDSCWYNMTVPEQKMILIMLREAQQASGISIGGVAPLSLNTALQMTKTIYTLSMMLKNFLD